MTGTSRRGRRPEPRIVQLETHPRRFVSLAVAAAYLGVNARTVRARIESGALAAIRDRKCYRIAVTALADYEARRSTFHT